MKVEEKLNYNKYFNSCNLCPRGCNVDRTHGETGYCGQTDKLKAARAALHMWEEPCISGEAGSGAVFFTGCQVGCVFCQNSKIAAGKSGKIITIDRLVDIFMELQNQGAANINLVTPTHFVPIIAEALRRAKNRGLSIPIVYNTSSYENIETLKLMEGLVDIYLPDMKYFEDSIAIRYSNAPDYPIIAKNAISEMVRQVGKAEFDEAGMMKKGVIVRHLVLPEHIDDSKNVVKYLYNTYKDMIYISIMNQYTPMEGMNKYPEINRTLTEAEYDEVVDFAIEIGVENGFIQEGETAKESFIPDFDNLGI